MGTRLGPKRGDKGAGKGLDKEVVVDMAKFERDLADKVLWNYLDDLIHGAGELKMTALQSYLIVLVGLRLGLIFNEDKIYFPALVQIVLGVLLDTKRGIVSLKPGFTKKLQRLK